MKCSPNLCNQKPWCCAWKRRLNRQLGFQPSHFVGDSNNFPSATCDVCSLVGDLCGVSGASVQRPQRGHRATTIQPSYCICIKDRVCLGVPPPLLELRFSLWFSPWFSTEKAERTNKGRQPTSSRRRRRRSRRIVLYCDAHGGPTGATSSKGQMGQTNIRWAKTCKSSRIR